MMWAICVNSCESRPSQASPASALGILLSPEKLIHSPRLRIYCQMLARGGVRFPGADAADAHMGDEKVSEDRSESASADACCAVDLGALKTIGVHSRNERKGPSYVTNRGGCRGPPHQLREAQGPARWPRS